MYIFRSLSHDTKKCDTLVYTSFFQPPIRRKQLENWPNTYAKRLHKLANRMLVKRLVDETTVDRSPLPTDFPWVPHSPGGIWSPRHQRNRLQSLFWTLIHEGKFLNRYYILYYKEMTSGCETFLPVCWSLKCQSLHSLNLYMYLYYYLHYQEHKKFDPGIVN